MNIPIGRLIGVGLLYLAIALGVIGVPNPAYAEDRVFTRGGTNVVLTDVSSSTEVYFLSMRFNRAMNQWNFELQVRNTAVAPLSSPTFVVFESITNATGPITTDGTDSTGKPWIDFSAEKRAARQHSGRIRDDQAGLSRH